MVASAADYGRRSVEYIRGAFNKFQDYFFKDNGCQQENVFITFQ